MAKSLQPKALQSIVLTFTMIISQIKIRESNYHKQRNKLSKHFYS